jgi:hypothetical protein
MSRVIRAVKIDLVQQDVQLPVGSIPLTAREEGRSDIVMWFEVDPDNTSKEQFTVQLVQTHGKVPSEDMRYLATVFLERDELHVYISKTSTWL